MSFSKSIAFSLPFCKSKVNRDSESEIVGWNKGGKMLISESRLKFNVSRQFDGNMKRQEKICCCCFSFLRKLNLKKDAGNCNEVDNNVSNHPEINNSNLVFQGANVCDGRDSQELMK